MKNDHNVLIDVKTFRRGRAWFIQGTTSIPDSSTVWNFWIKVFKVDDKVKNSCGLHKNFDYVRASE